ncbi:CHAP domain-containing protein [Actinokineospora diospyrosa]|uniref:CHAP domain-containing protein n=1 Tax=Actinokineospora diospyrosa TaxID=103728 RepID=A0ABT1IE31_9PSEU|nr:CHAP domain-containing protein [Actinokineospora diospyrosa]
MTSGLRVSYARLLLTALVGVLLLLTTFPARATASGYDPGYESTAVGTKYDQWGFARRNCTSFVAYKLNQAGIPFANSYGQPSGQRWGDAANWLAAADRAGVPYGNNPMVGAVAWWDGSRGGGSGHVAWVESINGDGSVNVTSYNGLNETYYPQSGQRAHKYLYFPHVNPVPVPPDGSYVLATDTGRVYVIAGRAPLWVTSWSAVGGQRTIARNYSQGEINRMPQYPVDGTGLRNPVTGEMFTVAGGFGFRLTGMGAIPNPTWIDVDGWAIEHQLRAVPVDGTMVRNHFTGGIYVVAGKSPMPVYNLGNVPYTSWTNVDPWAIDNQLLRHPFDGSMIVDHGTGVVHVMAGGAAMPVSAFDNIQPVTSLAFVDHAAIGNRLRPHPADGTVVRGYTTGAISVVAGGAPLPVTSLQAVPYSSWVNVDNWAITRLPAVPADGTHVRGHSTGKVYRITGGTAYLVPSWGPDGPQPTTDVDQWAITNQLHATE